MIYQISNSKIIIKISKIGAEPISILYNGKERLWQNQNGKWIRHAPILFPHAGKCSIVVNGKHYKDQFHGFLRDQEFNLVDIKNDEITLEFIANEISKETYPYLFKFIVNYKVKDNELIITYKIKNLDDKEIYYFIGCHESYMLDNDVSNYYIKFNKEEMFDSYVSTMDSKFHIGEGNYLKLENTYLDNSKTIILEGIKSNYLELREIGSDKLIASTEFNDFNNLLLWHCEGSQMICVEPWMNLPDKEEDNEKELKDKKYVRKLELNGEDAIIRSIKYY